LEAKKYEKRLLSHRILEAGLYFNIGALNLPVDIRSNQHSEQNQQ
jgi:hypothetical protein